MVKEYWRNYGRETNKEESLGSNHGGGIIGEKSQRRNLGGDESGGLWEVFGRSLGGLWEVSGRSLGALWEVSGALGALGWPRSILEGKWAKFIMFYCRTSNERPFRLDETSATLTKYGK